MEFVFDAMEGNLDSRTDHLKGITETFMYDPKLDRLTKASHSNGTQTIDYMYDNYGNVTQSFEISNDPFSYSELRSNQIEQIIEAEKIASQDQTIEYTSFNKPTQIIEGDLTLKNQYDYLGNKFYSQLSNTSDASPEVLYERYYFG